MLGGRLHSAVGLGVGVRKPLSVSQSAMRCGQVFTVTSFERSPMLKAWRPLARKIASTGTLAAVSFWKISESDFVAAVVVVVGYEKKCWRGGGADVVRDLATGIDQHLEIGAAVEAVDGIRGGGVAFAGSVSDERGHAAARGEAENANAVRVDVEFWRRGRG